MDIYANRLKLLEMRYGVDSTECGVLAGAMKLLETQPTIKPVYNPTLTEIMRYIDSMIEDEWQEFVGLLEARGWTLDTAPRKDEWCHNCKEYDYQKHYCPRFCRVIRKTVEELKSEQQKTCEGCKHLGKWENEVENGYPSPCTLCKRRVEDHYER